MTNAEFLNNNFGTNYKAWMKCTWRYSSDLKVWMLEFDGVVRQGWDNKISGDKIIESFVWSLEEQSPSHMDFDETYRLVVDKARDYKVLGVYKYDRENSNKRTYRIWVKVADSLNEFI